MAKIKSEDLRLNLIVNGDSARKELLDTEKSISSLTDRLKSLKKAEGDNSTAISETQKQLTSAKAKYAELQKQISLESKTMAELRSHIKATKAALEKAVPGTENWAKLNDELRASKDRLSELANEAKGTQSAFSTLLKNWGDKAFSINSLIDLGARLSGQIEQAKESWLNYDEALVDAMKTTGLTREQIESLSTSLAKIDTRTAQNELLSLARVGGKLGITGEQDLLAFVRAADKINVALKEDLGGDAEAAIGQIGKLVDIFQLKGEMGLEGAMLSVGSAINELGAASTANEGYIVNFTNRLAGIAPNAKISIDKILGLASTLDANGQAAETAATAIGQTITAMFKKTETFAQIAKMPFEDFKNLLERDVNQALLKVLEGMKGDNGLFDIVDSMTEMHLNGQRATTVLGALANNVEMLKGQQELANQAFQEGTSLTDEFAKKNESATATLEKNKKAIEAQWVALGEQLMPVVNITTKATAGLMSIITKLVTLGMKYKIILAALAASYALVNAQKKISVLLSKEHQAEMLKEAAKLEVAGKANTAHAVTLKLLGGGFRSAGAAVKAFGKALLANPIGLIIGAVGALIGVMAHLVSKSRESSKALRELNERTVDSISGFAQAQTQIDRERKSLDELKTAAEKATIGSEERRRIIAKINELYGDYLPGLLSEKISNDDLAAALANVNIALEKKIKLQARENAEMEVQQHKVDAVRAAVESYQKLYERINGKKMNASQLTAVTQAVSTAYDSVQADESQLNYKGKNTMTSSGLAFRTSLRQAGIAPQSEGEKNALWNINEEFRKAIMNGKELRAVMDGLYGSGSTATGGTMTQTNGSDLDGNRGGGISSDPGSESKWCLDKDEAYLSAKLALTQKYNSGEIASRKELNARLEQLEIDTIRKRIQSGQESGEELLRLKQQLSEKEAKQREADDAERASQDSLAAQMRIDTETDATRKALAEEDRRYQQEIKKCGDNQELLALAEEKHWNRMEKIRLDSFDRQIKDLESRHKLERLEMENAQAAELAAFQGTEQQKESLMREHAANLARLDIQYMTQVQTMLQDLISTGQIDGMPISLDQAQYMKLKTQLEEIIQKKQDASGAVQTSADSAPSGPSIAEGTGGGSLFGVSQGDWDNFFANVERGQFGAQELQTTIGAIGGIAQEAFSLASKSIAVMTQRENAALKTYKKNQDSRKKELERRLDAGLISESQYNAEVEKMDAEYDAYQEELAIKQAKREKALNLSQAIINTALSITSTIAQFGATPWGIAAAVIAGAMGAAEIALIAAQPIMGAEEGGFINVTRDQDGRRYNARLNPSARGFVTEPTVLVSENGAEYVIPNEALENPSLLPIISTMETARRNGKLKSIDFSAIYPAISIPGRASGGFIADSIAEIPGIPQAASASDTSLQKAIDKLIERLDGPITAEVSMLGKNGIIENQKKYDRFKKRGSLL